MAKTKHPQEQGQKDISAQLEALDAEYGEDVEAMDDFDELPTGDYQCSIDKGKINNSKSSGRLQLSIEMTVLEGKYRNRKIFKHMGLDTQENFAKTKGQFAKLGVECARVKDIPDTMDELTGTNCMVHVKTTKKDDGDISSWPNFVRPLDDDEDEDESDTPAKKGKKTKAPVEDDEDEDDEDETPVAKPKKKAPKPEPEDDDDEDETPAPVKSKKAKPAEDEDDEEEETPAPAKAKKAPAPSTDEPTVEVTFDDTTIDVATRKRVKVIAKENEIDPKDYQTISDLMADVAETLGVSGTFAKSSKLLKAIEAAAPAAPASEDDDE